MNYVSLGERIRRLRHSLNVTQDALAQQMGISPSFLGHLERGSRKASLDTLVTLCNFFKVSPEYLLADSLNADSFPFAQKLTPRQQTALQEIYRLIEATLVDWSDSDAEPVQDEEQTENDAEQPENNEAR
ncbi:MAG: helix-turn-helix transcriptional regulator [Clostridia bacterium]|nr:helix-turn-helix transcriptional regulator [Clostridia bacterium]